MNIQDSFSQYFLETCNSFARWLISIAQKIRTGSHFFSSLQTSKDFLKRRERERLWYRDNGDERWLLDYALGEESLVIEIGGHRGFFSSNVVCKFGCKLIIYEPLQQFVKILRSKFQHNKKVKILDYGLGGSSRSGQMKLDDGGSSLFNIGENDSTEIIKIKDVVEEFDESISAPIDLLSVNIEGAEYELMLALVRSSVINRIKAIQIQFHEIDSQSSIYRDEIRKILLNTHDEKFCYPWVWEAWIKRSSQS